MSLQDSDYCIQYFTKFVDVISDVISQHILGLLEKRSLQLVLGSILAAISNESFMLFVDISNLSSHAEDALKLINVLKATLYSNHPILFATSSGTDFLTSGTEHGDFVTAYTAFTSFSPLYPSLKRRQPNI